MPSKEYLQLIADSKTPLQLPEGLNIQSSDYVIIYSVQSGELIRVKAENVRWDTEAFGSYPTKADFPNTGSSNRLYLAKTHEGKNNVLFTWNPDLAVPDYEVASDADLSDYYTKTEIDTALAAKLDKGTYTGTASDLEAAKVDKVPGKGLSTEDYTTAEKTKLSGIEAGATADQTGAEIVTAVNLQLGSTEWQTQKTLEQIQDIVAAMFQAGTHSNISVAYDDAAGTLNLTGSGGGTGDTTLTDEQVQDIVGAFSTSGSGINVVYDDVNDTMVFSLTGEIFTTAYKNKLDGIEAGANKYIHPATHPATMITEDATHRFATDAEKAAWNAKEKKRTLKAVPNTSQYTLVAADFTDFILDFTANAGENISVILNTGVAPAGGQIMAISSGNNQLVPTAGTGVTLKVPSGANAKTTSRGWLGIVPLSAANTFGVNGNLESTDGGSQTYSVFNRTTAGLVPAPGGSGGTEYLREDGLWVTPPNTTYSPFTNTVNGLVPAPNVAGEYNVVIDSPAEGATLTAGQTTTVTGTITQVTSAGKVLKDTGWEDDIHVEDDATFDPTTRAGTNIITYTI